MISHHEEFGFVEDDNNNRINYDYFGSKELAEKALSSLKNCKYCWDSFNLENCENCSYCSNLENVIIGQYFDDGLYNDNTKVYYNEEDADDLWIDEDRLIRSKKTKWIY